MLSMMIDGLTIYLSIDSGFFILFITTINIKLIIIIIIVIKIKANEKKSKSVDIWLVLIVQSSSSTKSQDWCDDCEKKQSSFSTKKNEIFLRIIFVLNFFFAFFALLILSPISMWHLFCWCFHCCCSCCCSLLLIG